MQFCQASAMHQALLGKPQGKINKFAILTELPFYCGTQKINKNVIVLLYKTLSRFMAMLSSRFNEPV